MSGSLKRYNVDGIVVSARNIFAAKKAAQQVRKARKLVAGGSQR